jgi:TolA-binding protein
LIAQVSEIIKLYPPAVALSQQIAAQRVAATPDRLGAAAQERYNQAWSLYLSGAYSDAYTIVQDLWNNTNNQPYVPLQQLKKRLEVALHI